MQIMLAVLIGALSGVAIGWLACGAFNLSRVKSAITKCAQAEEKNFRIPKLESALGKKESRVNELDDQVRVLEAKLESKEAELLTKVAQLADKTVEASTVRAELASTKSEIQDQKCASESRLAEQERISRENIAKLDDVRTRFFEEFARTFGEVLGKEIEDQLEAEAVAEAEVQQVMEEKPVVFSSVEEEVPEISVTDEDMVTVEEDFNGEFEVADGVDDDPLAGINLEALDLDEDAAGEDAEVVSEEDSSSETEEPEPETSDEAEDIVAVGPPIAIQELPAIELAEEPDESKKKVSDDSSAQSNDDGWDISIADIG